MKKTYDSQIANYLSSHWDEITREVASITKPIGATNHFGEAGKRTVRKIRNKESLIPKGTTASDVLK
jgi:hypothetical protein